LAALEECLSTHRGTAVVLSWAPQVIGDLPNVQRGTVSIVAVPEDLRRAFKQGNAAERETEVPLIEESLARERTE
jgi:hypothetical protein